MKIYIPSRGRASYGFLIRGPYTPMRWLTPTLRKRAVFCVQTDEVEKYRAILPDEIEVMDCGMQPNLSAKRIVIARRVNEQREKKFMMCDDDVMLYVRKSDKAFNLEYPKPYQVDHLFEEIEKLLDKYVMVGISPREGNNRIGNGPFPLLRECTRSMRMYAFQTKEYLNIEANRLPEMADFDTTLQFLRQGKKNAVLYFWAQGQPGSQHSGGCSIYRTSETHDKVCRQLAELHPGFVSLRQKQNKGHQQGFGTRTEVTVQWKKAYESSLKEEAA